MCQSTAPDEYKAVELSRWFQARPRTNAFATHGWTLGHVFELCGVGRSSINCTPIPRKQLYFPSKKLFKRESSAELCLTGNSTE
jgi:hypothetical protein